MKILQINAYELPGRRFNGLSITPLLKKHGIESKHLVWHKDTKNPKVFAIKRRFYNKVNRTINLIERYFSLQSILHINYFLIKRMKAFKEAELIHLQIIQSGFFSIGDLPKITKKKPTIWTLHDPWALTGHCVHPFDCKRWKIGCGSCPDIHSPMPLLRDTTKFLFSYKQRAYKNSRLELIVASKWMYNMVEKSPMFKDSRLHLVPFGIDLDFFSSTAAPHARKSFGISDDALVICFRAESGPYKGVPYIVEALKNIKSKQPICLLMLGKGGEEFKQFTDRFEVIDLGSVQNERIVRDALVAADIFLMPSLAESFGMMAVESMACGKPVIVFDGTALPEVTFAPDIGISVPMRDSHALYLALQRLIDDPKERKLRGKKGRKMAELHYCEETMAKNLAKIYKETVARWNQKN